MPKGIKGFLPGQSGNPNGRPKGKTFRDYFDETEIEDLVGAIKKVYKTKPEIMKLVVEQVFGKASQNINMGGEDGGPLQVQIIYPYVEKENLSSPMASPSNKSETSPPAI